jgi:hypothetical protein
MSEEHGMKISTLLRALPSLVRGSPRTTSPQEPGRLSVLWGLTGGELIHSIKQKNIAPRMLKEMAARRAQRRAEM